MAEQAKAPPGLGPAGRRLWRSVAAEWALDADEAALLEQAARTADELAALRAAMDGADPVSVGSMGQPVPHPLLRELRGHRETLRRLLGELRLGDAETSTAGTDWGRWAAQRRWKGGRGRGA